MKANCLYLFLIVLLAVAALLPLLASAKPDEPRLIVMELHENNQATVTVFASTQDINEDTYYSLTGYRYTGYAQQDLATVQYYINTKNNLGLSASDIIYTITKSADTWDDETVFTVFSYAGTTTKTAGKRDYYNVIDFGTYRKGVIAVTMIWVSGTNMVEIDMRMNTLYKWSFTGEAGKMDVQNIATHEFGHWAGLNDVYDPAHSWLTMYGYSDYGVTYQRTLCPGDILGLKAVYG